MINWKIQSTCLKDLLDEIRKVENDRFFDFELYQAGVNDNYNFSKLGQNTQKHGHKVFSLKNREESITEVSGSLKRIPVGNYYLEFYSYRSGGRKCQIAGHVDLKWNKNEQITKFGYQPLYLFVKDFKEAEKIGSKELLLRTHQELLMLAIMNRLKQICHSKGSAQDPSLLAESIKYILNKHCEESLGNKENYALKILNRIIVIPESKNSKNNSSWSWDPVKNRHGTFSDCFSQVDGVDATIIEEILNYYGNEIILGEASEEGGRKGTFIFLNPELQKMRNPNKKVYSAVYEGLMHGESFIPGSNRTIYKDQDKYSTRARAFLSSNVAAASDINAVKKDIEEKVIFDRHRRYISNKSIKIGGLDQSTVNMLVVFVASDKKAMDITLEEFNDVNKANYSRFLHGADCHIDISQDASETLVKMDRKITYPITDENLSREFQEIITRLKTESFIRIEPDMPIGYKVDCENEFCGNTMSPVKQVGIDKEGNVVCESVQADKDVRHWFCNICSMDARKEPQTIRLNDKYQSAKAFNILNVNVNEDSEISINAEIISPVGTARIISEEGTKGLTVPLAQDFVGFIEGEIYNSITNSYGKLELTPVDMSMTLGSMKGKISGVALSHIAMLNAFTNSKICPDENYLNSKNIDQTNEILSKCKKVNLHRRKYNAETQKFDWSIEQVYAGIINIGVTELGDEFLKVKTDVDDMKVSHMNSLFYQWMGFHNLNKSMMEASFEGIQNEDNKKFILELFKMFYSDSTGLVQVTRSDDLMQSDFNNIKGSINVVSWLEKAQWLKVLEYHPLLSKNSKFTNGAYFLDKSGQKIVFPSRETIIRLVNVMNGGRVRLHGIVKIVLGMFLDFFSKPETSKLKAYKKAIFEKLTGKQGALARSATYINYGCSGKEAGSGYVPPGVIVVGNPKFWSMIRKNLSRLNMTWDDLTTGKATLYGTSQRDPFIWMFQALNAAQIWPVARANKYFKEQYDLKFSEIYPDFNGVMMNTLDMLYLFQTDADGDLRRILVPITGVSQLELASMNGSMNNYDLFCKADPESSMGQIYHRVANWHLNYVKAEAKSAATTINEGLSIELKEFKYADKNSFIVKGIKSKGNIGILTVSQWKIQELADYAFQKAIPLVKDNTGKFLPINENDRNAIACFFQTCFTQDGGVRSLKNDKQLGEYHFDKIAMNIMVKQSNFGEIIDVPIRDKVREEAIKAGYGDIIEKFFALADYWKIIAGLSLNEDGNIKTNDLVHPEAEMIDAYIAVCNGSSYMAKDQHGLFERLVIPESKFMAEKKAIQPLVPYLESILDRNQELRKEKK